MAYNIKELFEQATSQGYRSNIVKPLIGLMAILVVATVLLVKAGAPDLALISMIILGITFIAFLVAYFYCLFKSPDLLRSERYNLEKTAIEKVAVSGDSLTASRVLHPPMDYVVIGSINESKPSEENKKLEE